MHLSKVEQCLQCRGDSLTKYALQVLDFREYIILLIFL